MFLGVLSSARTKDLLAVVLQRLPSALLFCVVDVIAFRCFTCVLQRDAVVEQGVAAQTRAGNPRSNTPKGKLAHARRTTTQKGRTLARLTPVSVYVSVHAIVNVMIHWSEEFRRLLQPTRAQRMLENSK